MHRTEWKSGAEPDAVGFPKAVEVLSMVATNSVRETHAPLATGGHEPAAWRDIVVRYQTADVRKSVTQVCTTFIPLGCLLYLMFASLALPYWITLALAVPTAGMMVRTFIIMHDCGHGSFFPSRRANDVLGFVAGVLTLTPYTQWRRDHAIHHATSGDLERRGHGDIMTLTVREYLQRPRGSRLLYRLFRHPLIMFGLGPFYLMFWQRLQPPDAPTMKKVNSVYATNAALLALVIILSLFIGFKALLLIYLPVFVISGAVGIWLFYVQHQFEDAYWKKHGEWNYYTSAMSGSSYLKLPRVLQWFTGNIGLHHIHHLNPRIPNYSLQQCHDENPSLREVTVLTLRDGLKTISLKLWDEDNQQMIGYAHLRRAQSPTGQSAGEL